MFIMLIECWTNGGQEISSVKSLARKEIMTKFEFVKKSAVSTKGT